MTAASQDHGLVDRTLHAAVVHENKYSGLVLHSDPGVLYTALTYKHFVDKKRCHPVYVPTRYTVGQGLHRKFLQYLG